MIFIDTREQANTHILKYFDKVGLVRNKDYIDQTCEYGDYYNTETNIAVERKKNLIEFAGNCGKGHARFKRELERMKECGGKMVILIEQKGSLDYLQHWINPKGLTKLRTLKNGDVKEVSAMQGAQMYLIVCSWLNKYDNLSIEFVSKAEAPQRILEILKGGTK